MLVLLEQLQEKVKSRVLAIVPCSVLLANVVPLLHQSIQAVVVVPVVVDSVHVAPFPLATFLPFSYPIPLATSFSLVQSSIAFLPPFAAPFEVEGTVAVYGLYCGINVS